MSLPVMPTRILIVGGGGREHALAWKLAHEPGVNRVVVAPGSDGIATEPRVSVVPEADPFDAQGLVEIARGHSVELAVVGPEAALAAGVADALNRAGVPTFGPSRKAARIESSKAFCHEIALAAGVPMARGSAFTDLEPARRFAAQLADRGGGIVIKADGLAAGNRVFVCDDLSSAEDALRALLAPGSSEGVVIEERLFGREASLIVLADGHAALALPAARDHKRLADGDVGPNTGGMGAYSPVPDLADELVEEIVGSIHLPALAELARRGSPFRGALYAGLMLTQDGPVLLEFNARFGDPETQVILPRLAGAIGPLPLASARGQLASAAVALGLSGRTATLPTTRSAAVGIVLASAGYPEGSRAGDGIDGLAQAADTPALVFHAGTQRDESGGFRTRGGRVLTIVGEGPDLAAARALAEHAADEISFQGLQRRHDIAADVPQPVGIGR